MNAKHPPSPPMTLANMRQQGMRHPEINHLAESANFLAACEAGDEQALWQAIVYCAGHHIPLWEWLANELLMPFQRQPDRRVAELEGEAGRGDRLARATDDAERGEEISDAQLR